MKKIAVILSFPFCIIVSYLLFYQYALYRDQQKVIKKTIGVYKLDIKKTKFENFSKQEIKQFENLTLTFTKDSFWLNKQVPFMYDSSGHWIADHQRFEEWSYLYFNRNPKIDTQFDSCCIQDSTIMLNSSTPRYEGKSIGEIYFKKVYR
jgi:hypothetical protein